MRNMGWHLSGSLTVEADDRVLRLRERDHVLLVLGLGRHIPAQAGRHGEGRAQRCAATVLLLGTRAVQVGRGHLRAQRRALGASGLGVDNRHDLRLASLVSQDDLRLHRGGDDILGRGLNATGGAVARTQADDQHVCMVVGGGGAAASAHKLEGARATTENIILDAKG